MDLLKTSHELIRLLALTTQTYSQWQRMLTPIANGEVKLTAPAQEALQEKARTIRTLITKLAEGVVVVKTVHTDLDTEWGQPTESFRHVYSRLYERVYGSRALRTVDVELGRSGAKPVRMRTSTNQKLVRGGAVQGKKLSSSRRSVVLDPVAYEFKRTIDRKLRAIGTEIRDFLSGAPRGAATVRMCSTCNRMAGTDWVVCPWCGKELG